MQRDDMVIECRFDITDQQLDGDVETFGQMSGFVNRRLAPACRWINDNQDVSDTIHAASFGGRFHETTAARLFSV
jgi:hypothetical protein